MELNSIEHYYDKLKLVMKCTGTCTALAICVVVAVCSIRALAIRVSEDNDLVTKNKALFLTHCIKHDKMPWYVCESVWNHFSYKEQYYYNVEAVKYY